MSKKVFLKGTLILACTGLISRLAGFFYRIFLSHTIGAAGMGLYQLVLPLQGLMCALSYAGIQSALSRLIASKLALCQKKEAHFSLLLGTCTAVFLSSVTGLFVFQKADFFASAILKAPKTANLLRLISFTVPVCAVHSCIGSYYFARKKAFVPAATQLTEQAVRIGAAYVLYLIFLRENRPVTALIAAGGSLAGEIAATLASLLAVSFYFGNHTFSREEARSLKTSALLEELFELSFPVSLNRILLTLLGSIEVVLIPQMLLRSGLTASDSLKTYGVFTGMALPLILFPSTLTASASVMLMPSVAELDALGDQKQIRLFLFAWSLAFFAEAASFFSDLFSVSCFFTVKLPGSTYGICLLCARFFIQILCLPAFFTDLEDLAGAWYTVSAASLSGSSL